MKYLTINFLLLLCTLLNAQPILNDYIRVGLENNLALIQKQQNYYISLEQLKQARGLFYPSLSLNARYTVSEGGRVIEFPAGDLLNPVYSTLNQLTASNNFPVLENQEIAFLRPREHETKLRLVQPVFNTDIYFNAKIRKEQMTSEQISLDQYKRELATEIKKAYYNAGMAEGVMAMLKETRQLLIENVRINTKLFENDKVTRDVVLRSQTELYKFDQQMSNATKNREISKAFFNFLLNRPLSDSILIEEPGTWQVPAESVSDYISLAVSNREEISNLEQYSKISDLAVSMNRSGSLPDIMLVADYGFEGEKYAFNKNQDYIQASAVLSWDIFAGFQNRARIKQSMITQDRVQKQLEEVKNQIRLQVISSIHDLRTSEAGYIAAQQQVTAAREVFRLVNRRYQEGQASLIEFLDARNTLTQAEENVIISKYTCLSKFAEFENVIAVNNQ